MNAFMCKCLVSSHYKELRCFRVSSYIVYSLLTNYMQTPIYMYTSWYYTVDKPIRELEMRNMAYLCLEL